MEILINSIKEAVLEISKALKYADLSYSNHQNKTGDTQLKLDVLSDEIKQGYINAIPLKRLGDPKDIANAVAFLLSDDAGYITGEVLKVNGGLYM